MPISCTDPARFAAGRLPLDGAKAAAALQADIGSALGLSTTLAGYGAAEIVGENMANAASKVHPHNPNHSVILRQSARLPPSASCGLIGCHGPAEPINRRIASR
jgi:hypothetical protein